MKNEVDNLIVGGGIAGIWLAFQFLRMRKSFAMIDKPGISISSSVAAGIFNPILPGRQKKSYNADLIYPQLGKKYQEMETLIDEKVLFTPKICYILDDQKSLNDWSVLAASPDFRDYVSIRDNKLSNAIQSEFGYLEINHSGRVDILTMVNAFKRLISAPNCFIEAEFDEEQLEFTSEGIVYSDISAQQVIFCQGAGMNHNRLTQHLPLKPAKGEVLLIKISDPIADIIPQNGVFMLPLEDGIYKVGSNFEWDDLSYLPTEKAKDEILRKFRKWYKGDFEIIGHEAGLRPSSEDRRPIIGKIPAMEHAYIFNGLGSKGVALAPYYSDILSKHIYNEGTIEKEVDVKRLRNLAYKI